MVMMLWDHGSLFGSEARCVAESEAWAVYGLGWGASSRGPNVTEFTKHWPYTQASCSTWVSSFGKHKGNFWQLGFCDSGTQGLSQAFPESKAWHVRGCHFETVETPKGDWAGRGPIQVAATAAAKSLQLCRTLLDPIDGSPPGSPIPGILQARTLEWVAISFSNPIQVTWMQMWADLWGKWKKKRKWKSLSHVWFFAISWTAHQASLSMKFSRKEYWNG